MTYLELINAVLTRLREDTITVAQYDSDPFYRLIGALVNDAKNTVEDSWSWSHLRGTDSIMVSQSDTLITLPNSIDNHYHISSILVEEQGSYLGEQTGPWLREKYKNNTVTPVSEGIPQAYGYGVTTSLGEEQITLYPPADASYTFAVEYIKRQAALSASTDRLLVPSLPVYSLATALASRERGEIGGTPTSELFVLSERHLSDAIAHDSERFPEELEWYANDRWENSNVRNA